MASSEPSGAHGSTGDRHAACDVDAPEKLHRARSRRGEIVERDEAADAAIREHVGYAVIASAIPIPVADVLAVTAIQLDLVRQLARLYVLEYEESWGKAVVPSLVGATAARAGASAIKVLPGVGWFIGATTQAALSGASTWAVGQIFRRHFAAGGTPDTLDLSAVRETYALLVRRGRDFVERPPREDATPADVAGPSKVFDPT
jgi:uncharacterized protein (DUF697 family)